MQDESGLAAHLAGAWSDEQDEVVRAYIEALREDVRREIAAGPMGQGLHADLARMAAFYLGDGIHSGETSGGFGSALKPLWQTWRFPRTGPVVSGCTSDR